MRPALVRLILPLLAQHAGVARGPRRRAVTGRRRPRRPSRKLRVDPPLQRPCHRAQPRAEPRGSLREAAAAGRDEGRWPRGGKALHASKSLVDRVASWEASRRPLGASWGPLGSSWSHPRASWRPLGPSWTQLGRLGALLDRLGAVLDPSWTVLGASWAVLGASWRPKRAIRPGYPATIPLCTPPKKGFAPCSTSLARTSLFPSPGPARKRKERLTNLPEIAHGTLRSWEPWC